MTVRRIVAAAAAVGVAATTIIAPMGAAQAGQKISKTTFGMHSFQQGPGLSSKAKGSLRLNFSPSWRDLNPSKGTYRWDLMDGVVANAKAWGYSDLLYVFAITPQWAASGKTIPGLGGRQICPQCAEAPASMSDYKTFVTEVVKRYGSQIDAYQAWNEITSPQFWQGTAKQMAKMTQILNSVVNKYDRSATVVSGSVQTHAQAYYDRVAPAYFAAMKSKGWPTDVVAGHFYPLAKGGPDQRMKQIAMFQRDVDRYGGGRKDQWDTEANFWTTIPNSTPPNPDGRVRGKKAATWVARNYLDTWRTGLKRSYWYMWTVGDQDLGFPGIQMRSDLAPAREAYDTLAGWTVGSRFNGCTTKGKLVTCTFKKGGTFQIAFTTKGKATAKFSGSKSVTPVFGGGTVTANGSTKVGTMPVRIG